MLTLADQARIATLPVHALYAASPETSSAQLWRIKHRTVFSDTWGFAVQVSRHVWAYPTYSSTALTRGADM